MCDLQAVGMKIRHGNTFFSRLAGLLSAAKYKKESKMLEDPKGPNAINTCSDKLIKDMNLFMSLNCIDP